MSGSDFPEGKDWVKGADGRWYPPPGTPASADVASDSTAPVSAKRGWVVILALVGLVSFCSIAVSDDADELPGSAELEYEAQDVCHQFVEKRLRAPATARFERFDEATITVSGGVHTVRGHVDSENGYGALVRSNYTCQVRHTDGHEFELLSVTGL